MKKNLLTYLLGITLVVGLSSCEKDEDFKDNKYQQSIQTLDDEIITFEAEILGKQIKLVEGLEKKNVLNNKVISLKEEMLMASIDKVHDLLTQIEALEIRLEDAEQNLYLNRAAEIKMILDGINRDDVELLGLTDRLLALEKEYEELVKHINEHCYLDAIEVLNSLEEGIRDIAALAPPTYPGNVTLANLQEFVDGDFGAIAGDLLIDAYRADNAPIDFSAFEKLVFVAGNVEFFDIYVAQDCAGLSNLKEIGGDFDIKYCEDLTSLTGLENLEVVGGTLAIGNYMENLTDISALSNLKACKGISLSEIGVSTLSAFSNITEIERLQIGRLHQITSLEGLNNLATVNEISIGNNEKLENIDALMNINEVSGYIALSDNSALTSLSGLSNLTTVKGYFNIGFLPALRNLQGLENLTSVVDGLAIGGSDPTKKMLDSLEGLDNFSYSESTVTVQNTNITNVDALRNLNSVWGITFAYNSNLSDYCGLNSSLLNSGLNYSVFNNAYNPTLDNLINNECSAN